MVSQSLALHEIDEVSDLPVVHGTSPPMQFWSSTFLVGQSNEN